MLGGVLIARKRTFRECPGVVARSTVHIEDVMALKRILIAAVLLRRDRVTQRRRTSAEVGDVHGRVVTADHDEQAAQRQHTVKRPLSSNCSHVLLSPSPGTV
jgi:hypothetical protein